MVLYHQVSTAALKLSTFTHKKQPNEKSSTMYSRIEKCKFPEGVNFTA